MKIKYIYNRYDALVKQLKYQRVAYYNHRLTHRRKCMILSHLETLLWLETMCQRINGQKSFQGLAIDKFTCHLSITSYALLPKKRRKKKGNTKLMQFV